MVRTRVIVVGHTKCQVPKLGLGQKRNHQAYLFSVVKCNEPAVEVVVVVLVVVVVPVLVVAVPAYTIIYSVTFPHASATILRTKK